MLLASAAHGAPGDRATALAQYEATLADRSVPAGWTGSAQGCVVGEESQASLDATLNTLNTIRSFAGISTVGFDPDLNRTALAAALMMQASGEVEHKPGPGWPCVSQEGTKGLANSNLSGWSGAAAMIDAYMDEGGSLGHRRGLIDPSLTAFGSGSTGQYNALYSPADQPLLPVPDGRTVSWPPPGWVPWPWVFKTFSITVHGGDALSGDPRVVVKVDGEPVAVESPRQYPPDDYSADLMLAWEADLPTALHGGDHEIKVSVPGVTANGTPIPIDYTINAFSVEPVGSAAACNRARQRLRSAKQNLRRLKRSGAAPRRVRAARSKVRRARSAVRSRC